MKTLQECKDEIARKEGHADWMTCCFRENLTSIELIMEQVAKLYASEACKEQREVCANECFDANNAVLIMNAPEPKML